MTIDSAIASMVCHEFRRQDQRNAVEYTPITVDVEHVARITQKANPSYHTLSAFIQGAVAGYLVCLRPVRAM